MAVILEEDLLKPRILKILNEEQEQWFKERMAVPTWGRPYKAMRRLIGLVDRAVEGRS